MSRADRAAVQEATDAEMAELWRRIPSAEAQATFAAFFQRKAK